MYCGRVYSAVATQADVISFTSLNTCNSQYSQFASASENIPLYRTSLNNEAPFLYPTDA